MKWMKRIFLALALLVALVAGVVYWLLWRSQPQYSGEVQLPGLENTVEVRFDHYGIPHIYAQSDVDAYYALGYVHAQERLFQMDLLRRIGAGRLAELLGPSVVRFDKFFRTLGTHLWAKRQVATHLTKDGPMQRAAVAYQRGINQFIASRPRLPEYLLLGLEPQPFVPEDFYHTAGYMAFSFADGFKSDAVLSKIQQDLGEAYLADLLTGYVPGTYLVPVQGSDSIRYDSISSTLAYINELLPSVWFEGSNSWLVSPQRSKSGKALLANDPHIGFSQPAVWFEAYLEAPTTKYYGHFLAGIPFGLVGHTDFSANGLTMFVNDEVDYYRERQNPDNATQYWAIDHWEEYRSRQEVIKIKGGTEETHTVLETRHGPLLNKVQDEAGRNGEAPLAVWWELTQGEGKIMQAMYLLNHTQSLDDARRAASWIQSPGLNLMYADRDGTIAWWATARLPIRPAHVNSALVLDGSSGRDDMLGYHPFSKNPKLLNPEQGFIASANSQPDSSLGLLVPGYYYSEHRIGRIVEQLSSREKWSLEEMKKLIVDDTAPHWVQLAKIMSDAVAQQPLNPAQQAALTTLSTWNGVHDLNQTAPSIFYKWLGQAWVLTVDDDMGEISRKSLGYSALVKRSLWYLMQKDSSPWWDNRNTPARETRAQILHQALEQALADLQALAGPDPAQWTWDKLHTVEHAHAMGSQKPLNVLFNVGPFALPGGEDVINKTGFSPFTDKVFAVNSGPSLRFLVDFADMAHSWNVLPTGQSGHPLSPHYGDQATLHNSGELRPQIKIKDELPQGSERLLLLKP